MTTLCKKLFSWWKKKPNIRFYSVHEGAVDLYPIIKSSYLKRSCLDKDLYSPDVLPTSNCPGIRKVTSAGYIILAPADFEITTSGDGVSFSWNEAAIFNKGYHGTESYVNYHSQEQSTPILKNFENVLKTVIKIETPWRVEASDDIVFLQIPVTYNNESRFEAAIGIMDPKYSHAINVQIYWKELNSSTLVKAGTPLCQYIPINRKTLSGTEALIEYANENDLRRERSYNYAANCAFLKSDPLSSRLGRLKKILAKYKTIGD